MTIIAVRQTYSDSIEQYTQHNNVDFLMVRIRQYNNNNTMLNDKYITDMHMIFFCPVDWVYTFHSKKKKKSRKSTRKPAKVV